MAWLIAVTVAFVLGFLLASWRSRHHPVTPCSQAGLAAEPDPGTGPAAGGGTGLEKTPGTGSPVKLGAKGGGDGSVSGTGANVNGSGAPASLGGGGTGSGDLASGGLNDASGKTVSKGTAATVNGGGGQIDDGGGGGSGTMQPGAVQSQPEIATASAGSTGTAPVPAGSGASSQLGPGDPDLPIKPDAPGDRVVGARDLSYDRSGLPRYPNEDRVASAIVVPPGGGVSDSNSTVATILTRDDPDRVAAWYRAHLPANWTAMALPSAEETDKAAKQASTSASPDSPLAGMLKALSGGQQQQALPGVAKARAAHLTLFLPPDGTKDTRSVMVLIDKKTGETAVVLSKKAAKP